jgi:hypothetical protein
VSSRWPMLARTKRNACQPRRIQTDPDWQFAITRCCRFIVLWRLSPWADGSGFSGGYPGTSSRGPSAVLSRLRSRNRGNASFR